MRLVKETLADLAKVADRQDARMAAFDHLLSASTLFVVADELRVMAATVHTHGPSPAAFDLLVSAQLRIASAAQKLDVLLEEGSRDSVGSGDVHAVVPRLPYLLERERVEKAWR